ncbi:unnamed protein product [Adineta ricciae]|uniref:Runt domain-containing protein n=1 Tax=Adineta ricciae TaxID=249248 RepID=A0A814SWR2_ADIRI|nr:unnamed protein product [Adineta ricciae]CAF1153532.1 unnamed protein product [Adineta ricciae]
MAFERRRLSTESDKSSTSTTHSTESTGNYPSISTDHKPIVDTNKISVSTNTSKSNLIKRCSPMSSPAELLLARTKNTFIDLNPYFECSSLPNHWRKNKSLHFVLRAKNLIEIKPNTRVIVLAGNDFNPCATLKNNVSWFRNGHAEFNDLRFLGASGRGKKFTLSIIIQTTPPQQCTYRRAIKITVDGPRKKRELKQKSDVNDIHADDSTIDGDSDNESHTTSTSMIVDTKSNLGQSDYYSSGLLLLANAAEKKRNDEKDESLNCFYQSPSKGMFYSTSYFSPSSPLAKQFTHSIVFSPTSDDLPLHVSRHGFLPNPSTMTTLPTTNFLWNLTSPSNHFDIYHHQQQQTITSTSTNTSSTTNSSTNKHVLCR